LIDYLLCRGKKIFKEFFAKSDFHIIPHREQEANIKFARKDVQSYKIMFQFYRFEMKASIRMQKNCVTGN